MEDVFNLEGSKSGSYLNDTKKNDDGLLRPKLEEGRDGKRELVIRLLPNLQRDGKIGPTALEKHIHYANFKNNPELQGYFDCLKNSNIGKDCPLCKTYWNLKNDKNPTNQDNAKLINRSTKYYAYAYVVEDQQVPENEGKIFIFPFGYKIFQKIKMKAESTRKPVKVEDLIYGANLNLVIQEIGGFYNYDASEFEAPEAIEFNGKKLKVGADGSIDEKEKQRVFDFLLSREFDLDSFMPADWSAEQYDKVDKIISLLSGTPYTGTSNSNETTSQKTTKLTSSNVFNDDDDDDDDDEVEVKAPKKVAKSTKVDETVDEDEVDDSSNTRVNEAKKKAAAFFDDDEE